MSHAPKAYYRVNLMITAGIVAFIVGQQAYKWFCWDREYRTEHFAIRTAELLFSLVAPDRSTGSASI